MMKISYAWGFAALGILWICNPVNAQGWRSIRNGTNLTFDRVVFYPPKLKATTLGLEKPLAPNERTNIFVPAYGEPITLELRTNAGKRAFIKNVYVNKKSALLLDGNDATITLQVHMLKDKLTIEKFTAPWQFSN